MGPTIRWMIRSDLDAVQSIERESFEIPWTREDLLCCLRQRNCVGLVAETDGSVVGFCIYELLPGEMNIMSLAVSPAVRRAGVGFSIVRRLIEKSGTFLSKRFLSTHVREQNLEAQLFFKSLGFRAVEIIEGLFSDSDEPAYRFERRVEIEMQSEVKK